MNPISAERQAVWNPLLEGPLASRTREACHDIAAALSSQTPPTEPSLATGAAGLALAFASLHRLEPGAGYRELALRHLELSIDQLPQQLLSPSLMSGFTGVAWVADEVQALLQESNADDLNEGIDLAIKEYLLECPMRGGYDLIGGLVGIGMYLLQRLSRPLSVESLERIIDLLSETAEHQPDGITWWTRPEWLIPQTRQLCPDGYYNLGLAHGVAGVIGLLGAACAVGIRTPKAQPLLHGAVDWLLSKSMNKAPGTRFPYWIGPGGEGEPLRLAWCYGDLGIGVALHAAARCVGEESWERTALDIAIKASARAPEAGRVVDAGLCHGAAGIAHLCNRLYQATGESRLGDAARIWFDRALDMRRPGLGIAGFQAWTPVEYGKLEWRDVPGFLTGVAGVLLAFLSATSSLEPSWDRALIPLPPSC